MKSGKLRHLMTLRQPVSVDVAGLSQILWQDVCQVWAHIEPLSGREIQNSLQPQASVMHRITIRYMPGVNPKMTLTLGKREFAIVEVLNPDERNKELHLTAYENLT